MTGLNKFDEKQRRKQRRNNHIVRDLMQPKYHQRVIKDKRKLKNMEIDYLDDE